MKLIAHAVQNQNEAKKALLFGCDLLEVDLSQNIFTGNFTVQHDAIKGKLGIGKNPFDLLKEIDGQKLLLDLKAAKYSFNFKREFEHLIDMTKIKGFKLTGLDFKVVSKIAQEFKSESYHGILNKRSMITFEKLYSDLNKPANVSIRLNLVNSNLIKFIKRKYKGIKIIVWTVNNKEEIDSLEKIGVDGVLTDIWRK